MQMEKLEEKSPINSHTVWTMRGKVECKLPFLKMCNDYDYVAVEFLRNSETICALYGNIPDEMGLVNVYGFGMVDVELIGKGLGEEFFLRSLKHLHDVQGILGFRLNRMSCNRFSKAMIERLQKRIGKISDESVGDFICQLECSDDEQNYIMKLKNISQ